MLEYGHDIYNLIKSIDKRQKLFLLQILIIQLALTFQKKIIRLLKSVPENCLILLIKHIEYLPANEIIP